MTGLNLSKDRFPYEIWLDRNWADLEPTGSARIDACLIDCSGGLPNSPFEITRGKHVSFYPSEAAARDGETVDIPVHDRESFHWFARTWWRLLQAQGGGREVQS